MDKYTIIEFLKLHKQEFKNRFNITKIALFGSYSKGLEDSNSDIDIIIEMKDRNYFKLIEFEKFVSSRLNKKVDVGFFDSMKSFIKNSIQRDLVYV